MSGSRCAAPVGAEANIELFFVVPTAPPRIGIHDPVGRIELKALVGKRNSAMRSAEPTKSFGGAIQA